MYQETIKELFAFIENSPSCFHAIANMTEQLSQAGFEELSEASKWHIEPGHKYYVTRNTSSLLAFTVPCREFTGYRIMASHSDSPTFKLKENPELESDNKFIRLNVEKYGGMLLAPWLDRPLSIAGRVMVQEGNHIKMHLVNVDRDLVLIPNLAIHMNREANDGYKYNAQLDMLPLFADASAKGSLMKIIADSAAVDPALIVGNDLFLYNREKGSNWGANGEFISCARLDDLQCAFASVTAFLQAANEKSVMVHCVLDNEEVGSTTRQGAASTFLKDVLTRLNLALGRSEEDYHTALASSFMLSADNAQAIHPNRAEKADPTNRPNMNEGIVIKYNANQKYTTDAVSAAIFKSICNKADIPCQSYANRSDMQGGSTLGNISSTQVPVNTVDIGLAQLAMHSPYETAGAKDMQYLIKAAAAFYSSHITCSADGSYTVE